MPEEYKLEEIFCLEKFHSDLFENILNSLEQDPFVPTFGFCNR